MTTPVARAFHAADALDHTLQTGHTSGAPDSELALLDTNKHTRSDVLAFRAAVLDAVGTTAQPTAGAAIPRPVVHDGDEEQ